MRRGVDQSVNGLEPLGDVFQKIDLGPRSFTLERRLPILNCFRVALVA